jgi:myotubularin-related protein 6/7/8
MREWRRQGVDKDSQWRITNINKSYQFCETYPATMAIPSAISDITLKYAGAYRSKNRIPALSYYHPINKCTITRSSQPLPGFRSHRSPQDEVLLAAIFDTTRPKRPLQGFDSPPPEQDLAAPKETSSPAPPTIEPEVSNPEALENAVIAKLREDGSIDGGEVVDSEKKKKTVYGAQQSNLIVDARPIINAAVTRMMGAGSENMDNYKFASKVYLGIENIHIMRGSLQKVIDALKDSDLTPLGPNRDALNNSHWVQHIANMLVGVDIIVKQIAIQFSHVLIHCSDGWDRTSQLSALSQLCLDPYYRTIEGFIILVEKDWMSFGHRFRHRAGPLGSEKWFKTEGDRIGARGDDNDREDVAGEEGKAVEALQGAQKSLENAFLSAKGWFKQGNDSRDSLNVDSETEAVSEGPDSAKRTTSGKGKPKKVTKEDEVSPIFHQFLDATYQLLCQNPTRFEFNERFLRRLLYHLYSCQYGTFLFDNEKDRMEAKIADRTKSVWDYFLARKAEFTNAEYDPVVDDSIRGKERVIFPDTDKVKWWYQLFGRTDEEMNSGLKLTKNGASDGESEMSSYGMQSQISASVPVSRARTPVLTGVETADVAVGVAAPPKDIAIEDAVQLDLPVIKPVEAPSSSSSLPPGTESNPTLAIDAEQTGLHPDPSTHNMPRSMSDNSLVVVSASTPQKTESAPHVESAPEQQKIQEDAMQILTDDLDPLGIGDVKDHVPVSDKAKQRLDKRRQQMDVLLQ